MKRYGEKTPREALSNGATIRFYDWYTLSGGYRVMVDGEAVGYITCDLFYKLHQDGTVTKTRDGYSYSEYSAAQVEEPAQDDAPDAVDPLEEAKPVWRDYLVTICDTTSAEERQEAVNAINEEHARRIGWCLCNDLERVERIQEAKKEDNTMKNHIGFYEAKKDPDGGFAVYEYRTNCGWTKHGKYNPLAEADQAAATMAARLPAVMAYHPAQAAQEPAQAAEVSVDELRADLDTGDYGEALNDYRDSSAYICEAISQAADNHTSIYYYDILRFISSNPEALADVVDEGLYEVRAGDKYDLYQHGQAAEFMTIERDIYDHLDDALMLAALDFIQYDLKRDAIPEELADYLRGWVRDPGDRMNDIPDRIREYFGEEGTEE
jgi:hypothetical protein